MQARSLLFTIYGDFIMRYSKEFRVGDVIRALAEFDLHAPAVRMAVSRGVQDGLLEAVPGQKGLYAMTEKGWRRIEDGIRRAYRQTQEPWDGQWRVLTLSLSEERRDLRERLSAELEWRGFGALSPSAWISPHHQEDAVRQLAEEHGLLGQLHLFVARYAGPEEDQQLVAHCWDLEQIAAQYQQFVSEVQPRYDSLRAQLAAGQEVPDARCFTERVWLVHQWRKFLHLDPDLPEELLPKGWAGTRPRELFWEYYRFLSGGAERFFLQIFYPPVAQGKEAPRNGEAPAGVRGRAPGKRKSAAGQVPPAPG